MNLKYFTRSIVALLMIWNLTPGLAFCELKTLNDDEMSEVDAKTGGLFDTKINEEEKTAGFFNGRSYLDCLKEENACSNAVNCTPAQTDFFSDYQNPIRFSAPMPHCSSGGCR
jgi:hypothetical protein